MTEARTTCATGQTKDTLCAISTLKEQPSCHAAGILESCFVMEKLAADDSAGIAGMTNFAVRTANGGAGQRGGGGGGGGQARSARRVA